jgi:hypothetical protein
VIPNHILAGLGPEDCVAILDRGGELAFLVHRTSGGAAAIRAAAARDGSEVLATHLRDEATILEFVAARERDVGGEG